MVEAGGVEENWTLITGKLLICRCNPCLPCFSCFPCLSKSEHFRARSGQGGNERGVRRLQTSVLCSDNLDIDHGVLPPLPVSADVV